MCTAYRQCYRWKHSCQDAIGYIVSVFSSLPFIRCIIIAQSSPGNLFQPTINRSILLWRTSNASRFFKVRGSTASPNKIVGEHIASNNFIRSRIGISGLIKLYLCFWNFIQQTCTRFRNSISTRFSGSKFNTDPNVDATHPSSIPEGSCPHYRPDDKSNPHLMPIFLSLKDVPGAQCVQVLRKVSPAS